MIHLAESDGEPPVDDAIMVMKKEDGGTLKSCCRRQRDGVLERKGSLTQFSR